MSKIFGLDRTSWIIAVLILLVIGIALAIGLLNIASRPADKIFLSATHKPGGGEIAVDFILRFDGFYELGGVEILRADLGGLQCKESLPFEIGEIRGSGHEEPFSLHFPKTTATRLDVIVAANSLFSRRIQKSFRLELALP